MYKLVNIKLMVKLSNTSYHSLCISGEFNVPTASFNPCFNFYPPNNGVGSLPHKKYQKKIAENRKNFIKIRQSQGGSEGEKTWAKCSNKKGWSNKYQKQQQSYKKANLNEDTKIKNGGDLIDGKWM